VRSQGIEAEVSGEVLRNLQLTAGYTYNTTEYRSDPDLQGEVFSTWTPRNMLRVWASYRLPGDWKRLTLGAGFTTQSHTLSHTYSANKFKVPGYTVANLRVAYQVTPELNLAMNVNNLFDKRYWLPGFVGYSGFDFGDPRNVMFTLKYTPRL
jgi:outer membrane receptor for ferric coprogen and ferric-rhodotorulic acid